MLNRVSACDAMDILITGASGLVGALAVHRLSQGHRVYALVRHKPVASERTHVSWLQCDLAAAWESTTLPEHIDVIIHLAQSRRFREFPAAATDMLAVNVTSTLRLLDYARQVGAQQFIYASSGGLYGIGSHPFAETDALLDCDQFNLYLTTKFYAEVLVRKYAPFFATIILRPFFIYGLDQLAHMLIPRLISYIREGIPMRLAGPDGIRLNPIYNLDFVEVLERCLTLQESHIINVAGDETLTMRQMGETIGRIIGRAAHFVIEAAGAGDLLGDTSTLVRLLGYRPCISFQEGISYILKAYTF